MLQSQNGNTFRGLDRGLHTPYYPERVGFHQALDSLRKEADRSRYLPE